MYRRDAKGWLKHLDFMILDLIVLQVSFVLAYVLWHGFHNPYRLPLYADMGLFLFLCDLVIIFFTEPFRNILKRGYYREMEALLQQTVFVELFAVLYLFAQKSGESYSRMTMFLMGVLYVVIGYITRILWKQVLKKIQRPGRRSLLLVCNMENVVKTISDLHSNNYGVFQFSGLVLMEEGFVGTEIGGVPVVAEMKDAAAYAQKNWVSAILILDPLQSSHKTSCRSLPTCLRISVC